MVGIALHWSNEHLNSQLGPLKASFFKKNTAILKALVPGQVLRVNIKTLPTATIFWESLHD
jgi:hypothetical protein